MISWKIPPVLALPLCACACLAPAPQSGPEAGHEIGRGQGARAQDRADFILIDKSDRALTLYAAGVPVKTYSGLQFGDAPIGHKRFEGDERTPEGRYLIDYRNPASAYHLSLHISYPNSQDRAFAAQQGLSPGGDIFIHGQPNALRGARVAGDWTDGCIALSNQEIEELWAAIPDHTPIEIRP